MPMAQINWIVDENTKAWNAVDLSTNLVFRVRLTPTGLFTATVAGDESFNIQAKSYTEIHDRLILELYRHSSDPRELRSLNWASEPRGAASRWRSSAYLDSTRATIEISDSLAFHARVFAPGAQFPAANSWWPTLNLAKKYAEIAIQHLRSMQHLRRAQHAEQAAQRATVVAQIAQQLASLTPITIPEETSHGPYADPQGYEDL
jgi:hypothetical protein